MRWSLSEFLNILDLRGQTWCYADIGAATGVSLPHTQALYLHAVLAGAAKLSWTSGPSVELAAGDVVLLTAGDAHTIRTQGGVHTIAFEALGPAKHSDEPHHAAIGQGAVQARLMSGKIRVDWPGGSIPVRLPPMLKLRAENLGVDLNRFAASTVGPGSAAMMTRLASTFFVAAFRNEPRCRALFRWDLNDPVARSRLLIEKHPFEPWTVASLASKVGMGRSNFAARFLAQIGMTPIDALTRERMIAADRLLQVTDLKIAEISERVGYRSEAAFIRRFTAHFGETPGHRRRTSAEQSAQLAIGQS